MIVLCFTFPFTVTYSPRRKGVDVESYVVK